MEGPRRRAMSADQIVPKPGKLRKGNSPAPVPIAAPPAKKKSKAQMKRERAQAKKSEVTQVKQAKAKNASERRTLLAMDQTLAKEATKKLAKQEDKRRLNARKPQIKPPAGNSGTVSGDLSTLQKITQVDRAPTRSALDVVAAQGRPDNPIPNIGARRGNVEGNLENPTSMNDPLVKDQAPVAGEGAFGQGMGPDGEDTEMDDAQDAAMKAAPNSMYSNLGTSTSAQSIASMAQPRRGVAGVTARPFMRASKSAIDAAFAADGAATGMSPDQPGIAAPVSRAQIQAQHLAGEHRLHNMAKAKKLLKIYQVTI